MSLIPSQFQPSSTALSWCESRRAFQSLHGSAHYRQTVPAVTLLGCSANIECCVERSNETRASVEDHDPVIHLGFTPGNYHSMRLLPRRYALHRFYSAPQSIGD